MSAKSFRLRWTWLVLLAVASGLLVCPIDPPTDAAWNAPKPAPKEAMPFKLPPGFVAERVAEPPFVEHPVMASFDEQGRLFVGDSATDDPKELPNAIRLLEDVNGDGRFDKHTIFADKMPMPTGSLWHAGALYVTAAPSLWRLEDTKKKGRADKRQELVSTFFSKKMAADLHGPFLGPDGWLYWTDGAFGGYEIKQPDGNLLKGLDGVLFRCQANGTNVEVFCDLGTATNLGEAAFTPEGEPIAAVIPVHHNDALAHCVEGGVYFAENQDARKRTGDLLPGVHFGFHVAPSGMMRYRSNTFGADYRDNFFSAQFNTHKVQRHILERDGSTFRIRSEDFLVSEDADFHPTDVLEDADGSLLVIVTGGWFVKSCHQRALRLDIKGAIYRIRRQDAPAMVDPWGRDLNEERLTPQQWAKLLDDPRWVVRDRAILRLAQRGESALAALREVLQGSRSVQARRNAVWALTRMETGKAWSLLRKALRDADMSVRLAATHAVGLHRDAEAQKRLCDLVLTDDPAVKRQAATALGRIQRKEAVPALLAGLQAHPDRYLEHALVYALIQIDDREGLIQGLTDARAAVRRSTLIALAQMEHGQLTQEMVTPLLDTEDAALQKTALAILSGRGWTPSVVKLLRQWLAQNAIPAERRESLRATILTLCKDADLQELVAQTVQQSETAPAIQLLLLEAVAQSPLDRLPASWVRAVGHRLSSADSRVADQAVAIVRVHGLADFDEALRRLADNSQKPADLRVAAAAAVAPRLPKVERPLFEFLKARLDAALPPLTRLAAATALGNARLNDEQLLALTKVVAEMGSLELPRLLAAFEHTHNARVGEKLVEALGRSPGLSTLTEEVLRQTVRDYPDAVRQKIHPLLKRLDVDAEKMRARLDELEPVLSGGNVQRGRVVFFGTIAVCSTCHAVKGEGGQIGPDLSKIAVLRGKRDLLESVLFPSAGFARGYEPYTVTTRSGKVYSGILKRETPDAIYLIATDRAEIRVPRAEIDAIDPARTSIMPQGLDVQLSRLELTDLFAFLQSLR